MARNNFVINSFYCMNCGQKGFDLPRKKNHQHGKFHRKVLYCPWCKEEVNHIECRTPEEIEEFKKNFEEGVYKDEAETSLDFVRSSRLR